MTITADRFLEGVKRRNSLAENNVLLDDEDLLALADDLLRARVVPLLVSVRENYFLTKLDVALEEDVAEVNIPDRAAGLSLRDLKLRTGSDADAAVTNLREVPLSDEHVYRNSSAQTFGYYFMNDQLVLVPAPTSDDWVLEVYYEQRCSNLVKLEAAARVTGIASNVVTVAEVPSGITDGVECDFVRGKGGHRVLAMDEAVTSVDTSARTLTFPANTVPAGLVVGDYVTVAGQSPVLQIPDELHPILETLVSKRGTYSLGDYEARRELSDDEKEEIKAALMQVEPRNRGEPKKFVGQGLLRGRARRGRF
jgi:hypothetical protein